jgi:HK97 family phage major capsid protein
MDPKELEARRTALLERIDNAPAEDDIDALVAEADELRAQIDDYNARVAKAEAARARLRESDLSRPAPTFADNLGDAEKGSRQDGDKDQDTETRVGRNGFVEQFLGSEDLRHYRAHRIGNRSQGGIQLEGVDTRSLITSTGGVSNVLDPIERLPGITQLTADRPLRLADLITTVSVSGDAVAYVRDNSSTPYGAATEVAEGGSKPEVTLYGAKTRSSGL